MSADYVVDMGPGAGEHGGHIVAEGTPQAMVRAPANRLPASTCPAGGRSPLRACATSRNPEQMLRLLGARGNNLKGVEPGASGRAARVRDRRIGLGQIHADQRHALSLDSAASLRQRRRTGTVRRDPGNRFFRQGGQRRPESNRPHPAFQSRHLHRAFHADPRPVRRRAAGSRARLRRRDASPSTSKGGRCEACQGDGVIKVEMHFLPDIYVPCDVCHGRRYNRETLEIQYKGRKSTRYWK